jgi:RNA 2',3'-cyclic 3'-phosphodiesterase
MSERLFFALWPEASALAELSRRLPEWSTTIDGRLQRPDQWHVTLEFIGAVATERVAALQGAAEQAPMSPFEIEFDRLEHWRKPQVACLVASRIPPALAAQVATMRAALAAADFAPDSRPFRPHVTLARKTKSAPADCVVPPLRWPAMRFALVRSTSDAAGSRYEPLHWWNARVEGG